MYLQQNFSYVNFIFFCLFQSVFNVLGETLARLQQNEEAERWYQAALNAQPDHVPAHITYGKLLAKNVSKVFIFFLLYDFFTRLIIYLNLSCRKQKIYSDITNQ